MISFEGPNVEAYRTFLRIEVALRESLRHDMEEQFGTAWRRRLPGEVLKQIREAQLEENRPNFDYVSLGPLYYLTFGQLLEILRQSPGKKTVARLGGDKVLAQLEALLSPRNAACHSRPVPINASRLAAAVLDQIKTALGITLLEKYLADPDVGILPADSALALIDWLNSCAACLKRLLPRLPEAGTYAVSAQQYWWGNSELAGFACQPVDELNLAFREYNELPVGIGQAAARQIFLERRSLMTSIENAILDLSKVTQ